MPGRIFFCRGIHTICKAFLCRKMPAKSKRKEEVQMDRAKRKIRACLLFVVVLAVVLGFVWYVQDRKEQTELTQGTLVKMEEIRC